MTALIDVDQLRTFIAIAETGSFTKAAEVVNKTSAPAAVNPDGMDDSVTESDCDRAVPALPD